MTNRWQYHPGPFGGGNYALDAGEFYVSFNPSPNAISLFASDHGGGETALVKDGKFHILNGDFRSDYERLAPQGFDACLAFFEANKTEHGSSWSSSAA